MKKINGLLHKSIFLILIIGFISCGEGVVEIGQNTYSSKIVIEGYIFPGQKVKNIRITRNFPLNTRLDLNSLLIKNAIVTITDNQTNKIYSLSFNPSSLSYEYTGNDLIIDYDKSYSLSVQTTIDGKQLTANSTTRVPKKGFKILKEESILDSMKYREPDENGNVKQFKVVFRPSLDTDFYGISIVALDAKIESFIYNNPFIEVKQEDLKKDFDRYKYQSKRLQNIKSDVPKINYNVDWLDTCFTVHTD